AAAGRTRAALGVRSNAGPTGRRGSIGRDTVVARLLRKNDGIANRQRRSLTAAAGRRKTAPGCQTSDPHRPPRPRLQTTAANPPEKRTAPAMAPDLTGTMVASRPAKRL